MNKKNNLYRLKWDEPARTVTCCFRMDLIHPHLNRGLTTREAARLQSFDDDYRFFGNLTRKAKFLTQDDQVGNAVPPLLAYAFAKHIKDYIDNLLHESSIYLMTSYTESFGIVLIEAMSHGLPCVAFSSAEGARELIDSTNNGYLIHNRNARAYIEKVEDLMNDKEARLRIGKNARKSIQKYSGKEVIPLWYHIIEKEVK